MTANWSVGGGMHRLPYEGNLPSFDGATGWLGSPPLSADGLRGRVVLVNFWTYTCVNWLRQLPYVRAWHAKYADRGLVVLGVHTPEFPFEHDLANVTREAAADRVGYPVALDNDYAVWQAFANHYWPALYLADGEGRIRHHHFGEGEYARTEMAIQQLLPGSGRDLVTVTPVGAEVGADWGTLRSPENYTGWERSERFASPEGIEYGKAARYSIPDRLGLNFWALGGDWTIGEQATVLNGPAGSVVYRFHARDLNVVMGAAGPVRFRLTLDGAAPGEAAGADVDEQGYGTAGDRRLYQLLRQPGRITDRTAEIAFLGPGAETYSFTFG
jgi:thiol-disulfide isomerase/thioredoxin